MKKTMAEQLAKDLWRLEIPLPGNPLKTLNSYLILGERSLLIDTGFRLDACREAMERQLAEIGVDRDHMDIFATHLHSDHVGLAVEMIRPGCHIFISEIDGPGVDDAVDNAYWLALYDQYVVEGFTKEQMFSLWGDNPAQGAAPEKWGKQCVYLQDGDILHYGGHALRCILTPGHTPGHLCLYEAEEQWLFSGDHILFHITPNICRWDTMPDALGSYLESLQKIRDLPVKLIMPGHREDTGDLKERVDQLTAHHAQRAEDALRTVREHPGLTAYEIAGRMAWSIRCRNWEEFPMTQKFFAVGETLSHLDYLERRGKLVHMEQNGKHIYFAMPLAERTAGHCCAAEDHARQ